jgi:hypothetical protein
MSLLAELSKKPIPPIYAEILKPLSIYAVADRLDISYSYWRMILLGQRRPGHKLEKRILALAEQVKAELEQV